MIDIKNKISLNNDSFFIITLDGFAKYREMLMVNKMKEYIKEKKPESKKSTRKKTP